MIAAKRNLQLCASATSSLALARLVPLCCVSEIKKTVMFS